MLTKDPSFFTLWSSAVDATYLLRLCALKTGSPPIDDSVLGHASVVLLDLGEERPSEGLSPLMANLPAATPRVWAILANPRYLQNRADRAACRDQDFFWVARDRSPTHLVLTLEALFLNNRARVKAERKLLQAVQGGVEAMVSALASLSPEAYGHAVRVAALAEALAFALGVKILPSVRLTGLLSNLGAIALEHDTLHRALVGTLLTPAERIHVDQVPALTLRLLDPIAHIEPVKAMLRQVLDRSPEADTSPSRGHAREAACAHASHTVRDLDVGAQAVSLAKDYDSIISRGISHEEALRLARLRPGAYATIVVTTLATHVEAESTKRHLAVVPLSEVPLYATLLDDVRMPNNTLLVSRGHVVDLWLKDRLTQLAEHAPGHCVNVALPS